MECAEENAGAGNVGVLEAKPLAVALAGGFFLYPNEGRAERCCTLRRLN